MSELILMNSNLENSFGRIGGAVYFENNDPKE